MAFDKKQQIRGVRILLTVFYGFLLSSILFHYIIHGIVEIFRQPTNPYAIIMVVLGALILVVIAFSIYATWFDKTLIMLISGAVLIGVFVLTLVFSIVRIVNTVSHRTTKSNAFLMVDDDASDGKRPTQEYSGTSTSDNYAVAEDVTKLIIELIFTLFAILGTFILHRYVKEKIYRAVATNEPKPS